MCVSNCRLIVIMCKCHHRSSVNVIHLSSFSRYDPQTQEAMSVSSPHKSDLLSSISRELASWHL